MAMQKSVDGYKIYIHICLFVLMFRQVYTSVDFASFIGRNRVCSWRKSRPDWSLYQYRCHWLNKVAHVPINCIHNYNYRDTVINKKKWQWQEILRRPIKNLLCSLLPNICHLLLSSDSEISEVERELYRADGCPARKLLNRWGDRGMTVNQLAMYMDQLKLERSLMLIRDPGTFNFTFSSSVF